MVPRFVWLSLLSGFLVFSARPSYADELEIIAGASAAGKIKVQIDFGQPVILPVSPFPGISGYAFGELGVHSTTLDDPPNDFFQLSTAANFQFILLAKDPGMEVWNDTGTGFLPVGGTFFVGVAPFDTHPIWNIPDSLQTSARSLTLKFHDVNGVYSDSDPVTLSFQAVPEPGFAGVLLGFSTLLRRRGQHS